MSGLFDQFGRRIANGQTNTLYRTPSQQPGNVRAVSKPRAKTYEAVSAWQRREMVDVSRVIAAGVPNIATALVQAGEFSVGDAWHIKYRGKNKSWGTRRDDWFNEIFSRDCNMRGRVNDWRSSLRQFNWTRKVEADYGIWFDGQPRKDPLTGREIAPSGKFNTIKYDRISTGLIGGWRNIGVVRVGNGLDECKELPKTWNYYSTVTAFGSWPGLYVINDPSSPFDGQRIIDGVILDGNMVTLGYRIVGFDDQGNPTYADIPKQMIQFNFSAREQMDLVRGIPELAVKIMPTMHLDDIQHLVSMAVKLASAMAITRKSRDGKAPGGVTYSPVEEPEDPTCPPGGREVCVESVEEIYPGIVELATNNNEELGVLEFDRPSMNEEHFIARIEMSVLHTLWPRSLIYSDDTARAGTRSIAVQARTICEWDQTCVERDARWIADRATEFAMRMGYIPGNDNLYDPYDYIFTVPREFTVDEGNDLKMRLSALGRGIISRGKISEMDGYLAEEIEEERYQEIDRTLTAAEKLHADHPTFPVMQIALMLDNGGTQMSFAEQDRSQVVDDDGNPIGPDGLPLPGKAPPPPAKKPDAKPKK